MKKFINAFILVSIASMFCFTLEAQLYFQTSVNRGENDAEENRSNGSIDLTSSDIELCYDPGLIGISSKNQYVGLRFESVDVPPNAIIDSAFIQFTADGETTDPTLVEIYGELIPNASAFADLDYNISARTRTSRLVNWNIQEWNIGDQRSKRERTPNLSSIVSEIIEQSQWQESNSLAFIIEGSGTRRAYSWDESPNQSAQLHIYYRENNVSVLTNKYKPIYCYPNPALDFFYVDLSNEISGESVDFKLFSIDGRQIDQRRLNTGMKHKIVLNHQKSMVVARFTVNGQVTTQKIIIQ